MSADEVSALTLDELGDDVDAACGTRRHDDENVPPKFIQLQPTLPGGDPFSRHSTSAESVLCELEEINLPSPRQSGNGSRRISRDGFHPHPPPAPAPHFAQKVAAVEEEQRLEESSEGEDIPTLLSRPATAANASASPERGKGDRSCAVM